MDDDATRLRLVAPIPLEKLRTLVEPLPDDVENREALGKLDRIRKIIDDFKKSIKSDDEVGIHVGGSGYSGPLRLRRAEFWNPDIVTFDVEDDEGNSVRLVQNYHQLSLLLVVMPRLAVAASD